mgnify:FL=1
MSFKLRRKRKQYKIVNNKMINFLILILIILFTGCSTLNISNTDSNSSLSSSQQSYEVNVNNTLRSIDDSGEEIDENLLAKLKENQEINEYIVAVMTIPGTQLDVLIAYREGEEEYYLNRDIHGNYSVAGIPFMQQEFTLDSDNNVIIYGHYYKDGRVFGTLHNYIDYPDYYQENRDITIVTNDKQYTFRIFAVAVMEIQENDGFVYNSSAYKQFNKTEFDTFISHVFANNKCETGESVTINNRILMLSTCYSYEATDTRRVVAFAKEIE